MTNINNLLNMTVPAQPRHGQPHRPARHRRWWRQLRLPAIQYTYNSQSTEHSAAGFGWSGQYDQRVGKQDDTTAAVIKGNGVVLIYTDKNASGVYQAPAGTDALGRTATAPGPRPCPAAFSSLHATGTLATRGEHRRRRLDAGP